MGSTSRTVVVGVGKPGRRAALGAELVARGHEVAVVGGKVERLVARSLQSAPAVLVIDGALLDRELRAVAGGVESESGLDVLVVGPMQRRLEVLVALASGVSGYVPADSDVVTIADTVDALVAGVVLLPPDTSLPMGRPSRGGARGITVDQVDGGQAELTQREWEVLVLVCQAYSTAEIARRLVIGGVTVRTHVASLVRKLGVADRAALVGAGSKPEC